MYNNVNNIIVSSWFIKTYWIIVKSRRFLFGGSTTQNVNDIK